jgi:uncharacterized membrane protein
VDDTLTDLRTDPDAEVTGDGPPDPVSPDAAARTSGSTTGPQVAGAAVPTSPLLRAVRSIEGAEGLDGAVGKAQPLADLLSDGALGAMLGGARLGHALHPTLTDLPIGCWTSATVLDLLGGRTSRTAARRLTGIGLLAVVPTALTGWSDYGRIRQHRDRRVGVVHAAGNTAAAVLHYRSWRARRRGRHLRGAVWGLAGNAAAGASAYLGGHLALGHAEGSGERFHEA